MAEISYTVAVTFDKSDLVDEWLRWLREGHIAEVLAGGASSAEIVALDATAGAYEVRYRFPSRGAFEKYEREHAPRLRAEGLRLFPLEKSITYRRSLGTIVDSFPQPAIQLPLGQCPACNRVFDGILDYPAVRIISVELLPIPEAVDSLSDAANQKRLARRRQEPWNRSLPDETINMTPSIAHACGTPEASAYLKHLATLTGQKTKPAVLLPRRQAPGVIARYVTMRICYLFLLVLGNLALSVQPHARASEPADPVKLTDYFPLPESKGGWRTLLPEQGPPDAAQKQKIREVAGVDWDKLAEAWDYNLTGDSDSALVVIRRGWIVGEWYRGYDREKRRGLYSTTKSYMSTAFGLLLDDMDKGRLSERKQLTLDTKVCNKEWLPEALPLSDPRKADITLRHLLFATSGIPQEGLKVPEAVQAKSKGSIAMSLGLVEGSPWAKLTGEPGTMFNYSTPGVWHMILVFNHAAGHDLFPYIKDRVCDPIGMEQVNWGKSGDKGGIGPYCSPGGFTCSAREHARFCYLSMRRGNWAGKQIVPASYYDWAWQGTKANPAYGAQWWLAAQHPGAPKDFVQTFGQRHNSGCLVPSLDLVFVRIGDGPFPYSWDFEKELVKKVLAAVEK